MIIWAGAVAVEKERQERTLSCLKGEAIGFGDYQDIRMMGTAHMFLEFGLNLCQNDCAHDQNTYCNASVKSYCKWFSARYVFCRGYQQVWPAAMERFIACL